MLILNADTSILSKMRLSYKIARVDLEVHQENNFS